MRDLKNIFLGTFGIIFSLVLVVTLSIDGTASGFMTGVITGGIISNHCFVEGILVLMEDGYKPIEAVMAGNFVYAANEETGEVSVKEVVQTL